jgi:formate dehydrogenase major subunit
MPGSLAGEKDGTFTNTHRLLQWHDKVVDGPGDSRSELWFIHHLGKRLKELYAGSDKERDKPIQKLTWDYREMGPQCDPSAEDVLKEINGYTWASTWTERKQLSGINDIKDDGSTACGCWIYCGVFPSEDHNRSRSRRADGPEGPGTHLGWGFAWPENRRTLCNRASADPEGKPWSEKKRLIWWDEEKGSWTGHDSIDFPKDKAPGFDPDWSQHPTGMDALDGRSPFIMIADGKAALFAPSGMKDGPLPTHYEPLESPVHNALYGQQSNPVANRWKASDNRLAEPGDPRFPYAFTTYRLTEHHSGGTPTRSVPVTAELQPEGFAEIPTELARELGIGNTDWVVISTLRGEIETRALVTDRMQPFRLAEGRVVYQVGMPWHFGWKGYATGDIANVLTSVVGDPNTSMHENKALVCNVRPGRLMRGTPTRGDD